MQTAQLFGYVLFSNAATHSSRMRMMSVRVSYTSCRVTMLGCRICCRMSTSLSISSLRTPRLLARLCRFLMNLAAYSIPEHFSLQRLTTANCPLQRDKKKNTKEMEITLCDKLILSYNISLWIVLQGGEQVVIKVSTINNRMQLRVKTDVWEEAACLKQMNYGGAAHHFLFPTPVREQSHRAGV